MPQSVTDLGTAASYGSPYRHRTARSMVFTLGFMARAPSSPKRFGCSALIWISARSGANGDGGGDEDEEAVWERHAAEAAQRQACEELTSAACSRRRFSDARPGDESRAGHEIIRDPQDSVQWSVRLGAWSATMTQACRVATPLAGSSW